MEKKLIQGILYKWPLLESITGDDFDMLIETFKNHPHANIKLESGIKRIWVEMSKFGTKCFWIERNNGTKTEISFVACFVKLDYFKKACREEVEGQILEYKDKHDVQRGMHVDHHPESFNSILKRFVEIIGKSEVSQTIDGVKGCCLKDREYARKWQDFHQFHAKLRAIPAKENLKKKRS